MDINHAIEPTRKIFGINVYECFLLSGDVMYETDRMHVISCLSCANAGDCQGANPQISDKHVNINTHQSTRRNMSNLPPGTHILSGAESMRLRSFCSSHSFTSADLDDYSKVCLSLLFSTPSVPSILTCQLAPYKCACRSDPCRLRAPSLCIKPRESYQ